MEGDELDEAEFWLPSEFRTDEDILMDNKKERQDQLKPNSANLDFPYGYVSAETESSDEEDSLLLTELTRQLTLRDPPRLTQTQQKSRGLSGSPQSTLTQVGSWSGRSTMSSNGSPNGPSQLSSPPTTPFAVEKDPWDLIYQAAGRIARLKMNGADGPSRSPGILGQPNGLPTTGAQPKIIATSALLHNQLMRQSACEIWSSEANNGWRCDYHPQGLQNFGGGVGVWENGLSQSSFGWQRHNQFGGGDLGAKGGSYFGGGFGYGSGNGVGCVSVGLKRERAGTGVFLPRRYDNSITNSGCKASEHRYKPGSSGMQTNKVGHTVNKTIGQLQGNFQPKPRNNYEALVSRRNALLSQHRRSVYTEASISHEIRLPQEWTY